VDDDDGLRQVTDDEPRQMLHEEAKRRGVPLILPLQDLEDRLALSARDLWSMDERAVRRASERYQADSVLVGRYSSTSSGIWRSHWQLYHTLGHPVFDLEASSLDDLLTSAVNRVADHFAGLYAITPREEGPDTTIIQLAELRD